MMPIKTLPIGSVVQLNDVKTKVMICGRQQINGEDGLDGENVFLFSAAQIVMVYHIGYQDLDELHQKFMIAEMIKEEQEI